MSLTSAVLSNQTHADRVCRLYVRREPSDEECHRRDPLDAAAWHADRRGDGTDSHSVWYRIPRPENAAPRRIASAFR